MSKVQNVFLVGAKSLGAYGGYETFVYKLTEYHQNNPNIKYHVACKANGDGCMDETKLDNVKRISDSEFEFHNARCFKIHIPQIGPAQAIYYDVAALRECCKYIKKNNIENPIVYIMACRIGPFARYFYMKIHKLGGKVYLNPDGHEWMRAKWSKPIRKYWKVSEQMMVKYCDLAICDSVNIEKYIHEQYDGKGINGKNPDTTFIAYGADLTPSKLSDDDEKLVSWYKEKGLSKKNYYLVVGRFVPENSFEIMIREFMKSKSKRDFALITNVNEKFLNELESKLHFRSDQRIKFVGTVYDQELLKKIRENFAACGYAQVTGKPGVAYATSGPGATNLITGICNAYMDSIPTIFITGQVNSFEQKGNMNVRQRGFQETDIVSMVKGITKYAVKINDADKLKECLDRAFYESLNGRMGPVLLDMAMDVTRTDIDVNKLKGWIPCNYEEKNMLSEKSLQRIVSAITGAQRPVVLLGNGIDRAKDNTSWKNMLNHIGVILSVLSIILKELFELLVLGIKTKLITNNINKTKNELKESKGDDKNE